MGILAQWLSLLARPFGLDGPARVAVGASIAAVGLAGLVVVALRNRQRHAAGRAGRVAAEQPAAPSGVSVGTAATPPETVSALAPPEAPVPVRSLTGMLTEVLARPVRVSGPTQPLRLNRSEITGGASGPHSGPATPGLVAVAERPTQAPTHGAADPREGARDKMPVEVALQGLDLLVPPPPEIADTHASVPAGARPEMAADAEAKAQAEADAEAQYQRGLALLAGADSSPEAAPREAIACFRRAQRVWTRAAAPERWATTQNDIGHAYQEMLDGDRAAHLQAAIEHHRAALEVFDPVRHALNWAWTQSALGVAYQILPSGPALTNARAAVAYHQRALDVFTQEHAPLAWAWNQNNLGAAYEMMRGGAEGEWVARLREAETCYEAALDVYTREAYPIRHQIVARNLARVRAELRTLD